MSYNRAIAMVKMYDLPFTKRQVGGWPTYEEARRMVRDLGIKSQKEYWVCANSHGLPFSAPKQYQIEWCCWRIFLGLEHSSTCPKTEWPSYDDFVRVVRAARIKGADQYRRLGISGYPYKPDMVYKGVGWCCWGWALREQHTTKCAKCRQPSYKDACLIVQRLGFTTHVEYHKNRPDGLPAAPDKSYKNKGWCCWGMYLKGKHNGQCKQMPWPSYKQAKMLAARAGIRNQKDYAKRRGTAHLPAVPAEVYENDGWCCFGMFLGDRHSNTCCNTTWPSYDKAKKIVQTAGIKGPVEYYKRPPETLPTLPERIYKNKGWCCWGMFVRNEHSLQCRNTEWPTYTEAKKMAQKLGIKDEADYRKRHLKKFPVFPEQVYKGKGWVCWEMFLRNKHWWRCKHK